MRRTGVWAVPDGEFDSDEFGEDAFAIQSHGVWWVLQALDREVRWADDTHRVAVFRNWDDAETYVELCAGERAGPIND